MTNGRRVHSPQDHDRKLPLAIGLPLFAAFALAGNELGSLLRYPDIGSAILYPPYAALTAVLLVCRRRRHCLWYIAVASAAHFVTHWPQWQLSWVLFADVANIARAVVAAWLIRRFLGDSSRLDSIQRLMLFGVHAVLIAPAVGATIGAANVVVHGASDTYWRPWIGWFVSNALTGLAMMPAFIAGFEFVASWRRQRIRRFRVIEAAALTIVLAVTCDVAFLSGAARAHLALPLYAPLLVLIWAALRFGAGGASAALTAVALAAIVGVDRGAGPFIATSPEDNIFALQIFVLFTAVSILCLAVIAAARLNVLHLYRALLSSLDDRVGILDASGVVIEVNESWRRVAGRADTPSFHRVRVGDSYLDICRSAAAQGDVAAAGALTGVTSVLARERTRFELDYDETQDGQRKSFVMSVDALERPDGGAVVTRKDVTARRLAQVEIEEQRRELSHLARVAVLGQLSGALAHELNQPLAAILSNAEAARRLLQHQPPDIEELSAIVRDIVADDRRAAAVIQRLRALLQRGDRRVQSIDMQELIDEVLVLSHSELIARHIATTTAIRSGLPRFQGDRVQLQQVLLNLILNAGEAMNSVAMSDRRLAIAAEADASGGIHVSVRDSGTGIPAHLIDRLFEPFVTTKPDGLGLGLSLSRTIVAAHGGRLWAENNGDGGATLHCLFPMGDQSRGQVPHTSPALARAMQER